MGIYSRDYLRDDEDGGRRVSFGPPISSVCKKLIIVNVVVFILQLVTTRVPEELRPYAEIMPNLPRVSMVEQWLSLDPQATLKGQLWRPLTYAFCHSRGELLHLIFNMLFLWWFGTTLERMFGSREFLKFYLAAAIVSGIAFVGMSVVLGDNTPAVGASGAIMAIMMVYAMYFPRQLIYLMGIIPVEIRWLVAAYVVFDSLPILSALSGKGVHDGIAHAAHLGGLGFGFAYKYFGLRLDGLFDFKAASGWAARWKRRRKLRIYDPAAQPKQGTDLEAEVDRILAKIHEQGEASLTDKERRILKDASRKYRDRSVEP